MDGSRDRNLDHVTYASFGIDPVKFYAGKFDTGPQSGSTDLLAKPDARFSISYDRARFLCSEIVGPTVLDVGCGSGPYAATIRKHTSACHLVGVDLDKTCVASARKVYDEAQVFSLNARLPFPDACFDTVFSCDVMGHIEFAHKEQLVAEIRRVTRSGGKSVHIIESGFLPYETLDLMDRSNHLVAYVHMEGHVGIETAGELKQRWSRHFASVAIENAFIYPFAPLATYLAGDDHAFAALIKTFSRDQINAAEAVLGWVASRLKESVRKVDPTWLVPDEVSTYPLKVHSGLMHLAATA